MTITTDNYEAFFYQYQEGILPESQRAEVEKFLSLHPELAEEMMLYDSNLKMPQQQEVFEGKEELIRRRPVVVPLVRWAAAAAVAALLTTGVILYRSSSETKSPAASQPLTAEVHTAVTREELQPVARPLAPCPAQSQTPDAIDVPEPRVPDALREAEAPVPLVEPAAERPMDYVLAEAAPMEEDTTVYIYYTIINAYPEEEDQELPDGFTLPQPSLPLSRYQRELRGQLRAGWLRAEASARLFLASL